MQYAKTEPAPVSERTPQFRNIHFSNITAQTNQSIFINGLAEMPVDDITFNDIQFEAKTGATIKEAKNIEFHNVRITTEGGSSLIAENVSNLTVNNLKTLKPVSGKSVIDLNNVQQVFLYNCNLQNQTEVFLTVKGDKTRGVIMKNNNLSNALKALVKGDEVAEKIIVE
jgi:hypothetical protein